MSSPIIWGGNSTAKNLQNQLLLGNGNVITSNGDKNYITNGSFELGSTTGWSLGTATLTSNFPSGVPTFGSGASGNLAISAVSSGQLAGLYSMSYTSSAATTAGNFVASNAFTIDLEDQAKVLTFKFYYSAITNPVNGNYSGTSSNSFGVAIYDVTNSAWIQPAGVYAMTQNSGVGIAAGTFQTTSNSTQYRICVYNANATSGATTLYFDDIYLGPQTAPIGATITDDVAYVPTVTGFGSVTNNTAMGRYVGQYYEVTGSFTTGTIPVTTLGSISLPPGLGIGTVSSGTNTTAASGTDVGSYSSFGSGAAGTLVTATGTSTSLVYTALGYSSLSGADGLLPVFTTSLAANNKSFSYLFKVPIAGKSSNVQMSNDTDTRVISWNGTQTTQAVTANVTDIAFTTINDRSGSWNGTQYTVPVAGDYVVSGSASLTSAGQSIRVYRNTTAYNNGYFVAAGGNAFTCGGIILVTACKAGDTLSIRADSSTTVGIGSLGIFRLSGPAVIAATESVNARYYASATSISSSLATISWTTKDYDSHNAMSAGTYTAPVSGKFEVNAALLITGTISLNNTLIMEIQKNGSVVSRNTIYLPASVTDGKVIIADVISCLAGDTVRIQVSTSAVVPSIISSNFDNYFSIFRVGN